MKTLKHLPIALLIFVISCQSEGADAGLVGPGSNGQGGSLARFAVVDDHLFAVNGESLKVFDISDKTNPLFKKNEKLNVNVETIFPRDENTLFIGTTSGMYIYDISNAPNIKYISHYEHIVSCDPVVANQEFAFVTLHTDVGNNACWRGTDQLDVVDIKDLENPFIINSVQMTKPFGLGLYGDTLLVCDDGIKIFDVSNASNPLQINHLPAIDAYDLIPRGDLIIVAGSSGFSQYRFKNGGLQFLSEL